VGCMSSPAAHLTPITSHSFSKLSKITSFRHACMLGSQAARGVLETLATRRAAGARGRWPDQCLRERAHAFPEG